MLDDPNITKVIFDGPGDSREVEVDPGKISRLACVVRDKLRDKWHVEIIDLAAGVFSVKCEAKGGKLTFVTIPRKSYLPKKNKTSHIKGRYS